MRSLWHACVCSWVSAPGCESVHCSILTCLCPQWGGGYPTRKLQGLQGNPFHPHPITTFTSCPLSLLLLPRLLPSLSSRSQLKCHVLQDFLYSHPPITHTHTHTYTRCPSLWLFSHHGTHCYLVSSYSSICWSVNHSSFLPSHSHKESFPRTRPMSSFFLCKTVPL